MIRSAWPELKPGGRLAGDRRRRIEVVAGDDLRPERLAGRSTSVPSGTMLALQVAHLEPPDVVGLEPELLVGLHAHLVGPAEQVEVIDIGRPERRLERAEDDVERDVQALRLDPVDVGVELGDAGPEGRVQRLEAGLGVAGLDHLIGELLELASSPTPPRSSSWSWKPPGDAQALDGRRREDEDDRLLDLLEPASQLAQDGLLAELGPGPLLVGRPADVEQRRVRGVGLVEHRGPADHDPVADARRSP